MHVYEYKISYALLFEESRMQVRHEDGHEVTLKSLTQREIETRIGDIRCRVVAGLDPACLETTPRWIDPRDLVEALRSLMVLN